MTRRSISAKPLRAPRPACKVHGAAVVVVQVATTSHPSELIKGDAKTPQLAWIEEVRAPGVRLALHKLVERGELMKASASTL